MRPSFKVVGRRPVNSTGAYRIHKTLKELGVEVVELYCKPTGNIFPHNPETPKGTFGGNISRIVVIKEKAGLSECLVRSLTWIDLALLPMKVDVQRGKLLPWWACADYVLGKTKRLIPFPNLSFLQSFKGYF